MKKISFKKAPNLFVAKFIAASIAAMLLLNSNCHAMNFFNKTPKLPTTPYALPIDISKKGNKAEIDLRIKSDEERKNLEPKTVAFEIKFVPYDPKDDPKSKYYISSFRKNLIMIGALRKYFEPKRTKEESKEIDKDSERIIKLMEREELIKSSYCDSNREQCLKESGLYSYRKIIHPGIPIPNIRLTITDLNYPNKKIVYDEVLEVKKHWQIGGYFYKYLDDIKLSPGNYRITAEVQSDAIEFKGTKVLLIIGSYRAKV